MYLNGLQRKSEIINMNETLSYYEKNAQSFVADTQKVELHAVQDRFLRHIPVGGKLLDFGCGAGRDTKYFLDKGYLVDAIDGSENLCKMASEFTGINVKQMLFSDLDVENQYDGIWACSSILHLSKAELKDVIGRMIRATKMDGFIYTSFKYGEFEGCRGERYFTDLTEKSFHDLISGFSGIQIVDEWVSADARPGRGDEKWLDIILQKA